MAAEPVSPATAVPGESDGSPGYGPDQPGATGPGLPASGAGTGTGAARMPLWDWIALLVALLVTATRALEQVRYSFDALGLLDLQVYRMGGQAVLDAAPLYDLSYPHDALPFTYTPFAALLFVPLTLAGWTVGTVLMTVGSVLALLRTAHLVGRATATTGFQRHWSPAGSTLLLFVFGLAIWPTISTLEYGQINLVIMWLVVEDLLGRGRTARWGGLLIGIAAGVKLTPALFIVFLLVTRRTRQATVAALAAIGTVVLGALVKPSSAWTYWTETFFESDRIGAPEYLANQSINGFVHRVTGPDASTTLLWLTAALVVVVVAHWLARALWLADQSAQAVLVVALAMLLVSPISWSHHWVWLVMVPACLVRPAGPPEPRGLTAARNGITIVTAMMAVPRLMGFLPHANGREFDYTPLEQIVASAYPLLGLAVMAILAWAMAVHRHDSHKEKSDGPART